MFDIVSPTITYAHPETEAETENDALITDGTLETAPAPPAPPSAAVEPVPVQPPPTATIAAVPPGADPPRPSWNDDHLLILAFAILVAIGIWALVKILFRDIRQESTPKTPHQPPPPAPSKTAAPPQLSDGWQAVIPHGGEVFFPKAESKTYEIEIRGVCRYRTWPETITADAVYYAKQGRFLDTHSMLFINGVQHWSRTVCRVIDEDRGAHVYKFIYEGDRVALAFGRADEQHVRAENSYLEARVTPLPSAQEAREREAQRKQLEAEAERFANAVKQLSIRAALYSNWAVPEYRQQFAEAHDAELIKAQEEIRKEAATLLEQDRLLAHLRRHNPQAVETLLGRLDALQRGERVSLAKAPAAAEARKTPAPAAPKRHLTVDEVRALKVRRQRTQDQDRVALRLDKIETRLMVRDRLDKMPLDPDEREMIEREMIDDIDAGDDDGTQETI